MMRALGVPCSSVTRANGFVFVSGTPPIDMETGKIVRGDIEAQTEASLNAVRKCLEAAGASLRQCRDGPRLCVEFGLLQRHQPGLRQTLP